MTKPPPHSLPLQGVRIVDLTAVVMGPLATRMLADMGAEVIWVEPPGGDVLRDYQPSRSPKMSAFSMGLSRNKRSIALDLKTPPGRQALLDLVACSDVFVTTLRRKALQRLDLSEAVIRAARPDIIYCIANGFGSDGPYANRAAYDDVIQAASGLASLFGLAHETPQLVPSVIADKIVGVHVAFAIAAALAGRAANGQGASIEVPMAETMAAFNLVEHLSGQAFDPPQPGFGYSRVTTRNRKPRRTQDGWIVILPYSTANWNAFFDYAQRAELNNDPRFATSAERIKHADALYALLDDIVATRSSADWMAFCTAHSIAASEVIDLEQLGDDPHFKAVGLYQEETHPSEGAYRYVRDTILYNQSASPVRHPAPRPGADTAAVLREVGWSEQKIKSLKDASQD